MTISSTGARFSFAGNGTTTAFSFPRQFFADADLDVYLVDNTTKVATLQVLNTDYTVAGAGSSSGGTVTMLVAPPTGKTLVLARDTAASQGLDLDNVTSFPMASVEAAFDRAMMAIDEVRDRIARALMYPIFGLASFDWTMPEPVPLKLLGVNSAGTGLEMRSVPAWIDGAGAPAASLGLAGDYYLNDSNGDIYTKTGATTWTLQANIKGLQGTAGTNGTNGTNGAPGAVWRNGAGAPSNALGIDGDYYLNNTTDDVYYRSGGTYAVVTNIRGASGSGTGDVVGPAGATDNDLALFSGATGKAIKDSGVSLAALLGYLGVTSAAGTTTLTAASPRTIIVTGSTTQTIVLPAVTTLQLGWTYEVVNAQSSGAVTVQSSGLNSFSIQSPNMVCIYKCIAITGTGIASWQQIFAGASSKTGSGSLVYGFAPLLQQMNVVAANAVTAGTDAQGQGALSETLNIVTTAAANPSGVTLPTPLAATQSRPVTVINKAANPINVYPATGAAIDGLAANTPVQIPVGGQVMFWSASTTQWYSTLNVPGSGYTIGDILYASSTTALAKLAAGTSGYVLTSNGPGTAPSWQAPSGGGTGRLLRAPQILTSGTSYTTPAGCTSIFVECIGPGGGGGAPAAGATSASGSPGGAGSYSAKYFAVTPSTAYSYVIGAGGTGGTATNGSAGGSTTFTGPGAVTITAGGGLGGGTSNGVAGAAGGTASGGDINVPGDNAVCSSGSSQGSPGPSSVFGGGGKAATGNSNGNNGSFGGGGSPATSTAAASRVGGNGGDGFIRIWEYA